jgi:shikimate dehydrogenase
MESFPGREHTVDRYGVIGFPVAHSRSPIIHQAFARQTGQRIQYERLEVPPEEFETVVDQFRRAGGKGLNVTVPHKLAAAALADQVSERANEARAVNTLVFEDDEIFGDNTDGIGLVRDLVANHRFRIEGASILVLGAGGATRGIVGPLLDLGPARIMIANRTVAKAEAIADQFSSKGETESSSFDGIPAGTEWQLVINATSAGYKGESLPIPDTAISRDTFCYDLSYGLKPTPFCTWAKDRGAGRQAMGWGMLVEQAAESFHLWRGVRPETAPVLRRILVSAS